ncbi:MAG: sugar ABC transporter ATP-binding protein [Spirochaetia bacterium]|nr:sugar ABC transporter ATP-binding protein [Spirochaetia bacterium]
MRNIDMVFPGVHALKEIDFQLKRGEVHALVGENGAGKSTLMKILMGVYTSCDGDIFLEGAKVTINSPEKAHELGIGMIFQELSLVPQLNVAQNIYLGNEVSGKTGILHDRQMYENARNLMKKYNIKEYFSVYDKVGKLSRGYMQIVEVLKALSRDTKILIMDEPTASLTKEEEDTLYQIILGLKKEGVSIIYISHRLEEIFRNCNRVTVFRDGSKVETKNVNDVDMDKLIELMTGRKIEAAVHVSTIEAEDRKEPLLEVRNLVWKQRLCDVSFCLNKGEVLGITGLMGSGKSEIARALFGVEPLDSGEIYIEGEKVEIQHPWQAVEAGMALIPEDRKSQGLVLSHSVEENICLPIVSDYKNKIGLFKDKKAGFKVKEQIARLAIKTPTPKQKVKYLSGGNQQKIVVGKWLNKSPKVLILDEPTVGVDVKTKSELRTIIQGLVKDQDRGVLLFSSELNEILQLSDRVVILYRGSVIKEYTNCTSLKEDALHRAVQGLV